MGDASFQPGASSVAAARADSYMSLAPSIQVTFTSDKSKWTRCAVLEAGDDNSLPGVDVDKLRIKPDPSRCSGRDDDLVVAPEGVVLFPQQVRRQLG